MFPAKSNHRKMQRFFKRTRHKVFLPSLQTYSPTTLQKNSLSSSKLQNPNANLKIEATCPSPPEPHLVSPSDLTSKPNSIDKSKLNDVVSSNRMISCFVRSGDLNSALEFFRNMPIRTTVTWNSLLAGFSKTRGKLEEARKLFDEIPERDSVSYNTMLACYLKNSDLGTALSFFEGIPIKDAASWNTMITGFVREGKMDKAQGLFSRMWEKNEVSWNAMISGYVECGDLDSALRMFDIAPVKSVVSWTAMINGYMKRGKVELAERLFGEMPQRNLVTWNAMVAGYVENCKAEDGLKLFGTMMGLAIRPNSSTLSSVLLACSDLSALCLGCQVHQVVSKSPLRYDTTVGTSLVSMYCKCGDLEDGWKIFQEIPMKDVVAWNAIISGYAQHGVGEKALGLFDDMRERGVKPDSVTFVGVLLACNHTGFVDLGLNYFHSMVKDYGVELKPDHYTCMVDLLGRAGKLVEAVELIKEMPFPPHAALFGTLLGACRIHKNVEMAEFAAKNLLELDRGSATAFVQLANVYASVQQWDEVSRVRKSMKSCKVVKTPGYSWIEVKKVVHEFRSGDRLHPELTSIHEKLTELDKKMKLAGYSPDLDCALHNVGKEQKEQLLLRHSEKLAIAYGLIQLPRRTKIQVFKNLRICGDCHLAIKYVSAIEGREIIVRDTKRFHHFKDGFCSCGDYW